jgi:CheY-like chemotaxis protein
MSQPKQPITILMADDDLEDCLLTREALAEAGLENEIRFVHDGQELLDYLRRHGEFEDPMKSPRPGLILLDLNMPRMSGREALGVIKADPVLKLIPIVVLTTSANEADIAASYELGANSYITKPVGFQGLVNVVQALNQYWFRIVSTPPLVR